MVTLVEIVPTDLKIYYGFSSWLYDDENTRRSFLLKYSDGSTSNIKLTRSEYTEYCLRIELCKQGADSETLQDFWLLAFRMGYESAQLNENGSNGTRKVGTSESADSFIINGDYHDC